MQWNKQIGFIWESSKIMVITPFDHWENCQFCTVYRFFRGILYMVIWGPSVLDSPHIDMVFWCWLLESSARFVFLAPVLTDIWYRYMTCAMIVSIRPSDLRMMLHWSNIRFEVCNMYMLCQAPQQHCLKEASRSLACLHVVVTGYMNIATLMGFGCEDVQAT